MTTINLEQSRVCGKIKPMNAVNNGPTGSAVRGYSSFELYKALEIPYARNHDAAFYSGYGGEHTVDVHRIFKNFDADENNPDNYVFSPTDKYIANTESVNTKTFYRLGAAIEHGYKYGTYPPKDFLKWAKICEHIIMHYTEGWADGFNYDIEYWEIWNEPDCKSHNGDSPCWQGIEDEFIDFYCIAATYLKNRFPHLKIGGPAFTSSWKTDFKMNFLKAVKERNAPLDFYSYHGYTQAPQHAIDLCDAAKECLAEAGLKDVKLIYNEWNYIKAWVGEDYVKSLKSNRTHRGASFVSGFMFAGQYSDTDMMMYYDARPTTWNGLFNEFLEPQKPYYAFLMFKELRRLGGWIKSGFKAGDNIYYCAATDGKDSAIMLTNYDEKDRENTDKVEINFTADKAKAYRVEYYLTNKDYDNELIKTTEFSGSDIKINLDVNLFDTYLIKIIEN